MSDKNKLIAELDEISRLYEERNFLAEQIEKLPAEKKREKQEKIKPSPKAEKTKSEVKAEWVEKLFKKTGWQPLYDDYTAFCCPDHWFKEKKKKPLTKTDKWIAKIKKKNDEESKTKWENCFKKVTSSSKKKEVYDAIRKFDNAFLSMVPEYKENCEAEAKRNQVDQARYRIEEEKYQAELAAIDTKYEKRAEELSQKMDEISKQLDGVTIIAKDFIPDSGRIVDMLKMGRADTLKEAINLFFDEKRKDAEEAERRKEAARQADILWEQAYDNRRHNEAMQRAAEKEAYARREHEAAMERAAYAAQEQSASQMQANSARCLSCVYSGTCSYEQKKANICQSYVRK